MTNLAALLLASLKVVTVAYVLLGVGTRFAVAKIGQVIVMLGVWRRHRPRRPSSPQWRSA